MSRRIPILLFSLLIIAILTIPATIVVSADDGRGNNSTGGSVSGQGGGPGNGQPGNGPGAGNPASDNQTGPAPLLNGQPPSDNVTGHGSLPRAASRLQTMLLIISQAMDLAPRAVFHHPTISAIILPARYCRMWPRSWISISRRWWMLLTRLCSKTILFQIMLRTISPRTDPVLRRAFRLRTI